MRLMGFIVALAMAMAALKLAAAVMALLIVGGLVWSAITRPKETLGWLAGFAALQLASLYPVPSILAVGVIALIAATPKR